MVTCRQVYYNSITSNNFSYNFVDGAVIITIPAFQQMIVNGEIDIEGELIIEGEINIINV